MDCLHCRTHTGSSQTSNSTNNNKYIRLNRDHKRLYHQIRMLERLTDKTGSSFISGRVTRLEESPAYILTIRRHRIRDISFFIVHSLSISAQEHVKLLLQPGSVTSQFINSLDRRTGVCSLLWQRIRCRTVHPLESNIPPKCAYTETATRPAGCMKPEPFFLLSAIFFST